MNTGSKQPDRPEPSVEVARLVYDETRRMLEHQSSSLDELRGRTSSLLAVVGVGTAFLSGVALTGRTEPLNFWTWVGFISPVVTVVLVGLILLPVYGWIFHHKPDWLLDKYYWGKDYDPPWPARIDQAYVWITEDLDGWRKTNRKRLRWLYLYYRLALISGVVAVAAWITDLVVIRSVPG